MSDYINRLVVLGYSQPDAYYTVEDMMREVGEDGLKEFIEGLEENVRALQSKPRGKKCRGLCGSCSCKGIRS